MEEMNCFCKFPCNIYCDGISCIDCYIDDLISSGKIEKHEYVINDEDDIILCYECQNIYKIMFIYNNIKYLCYYCIKTKVKYT